jgi:POT family proton-dependent oligopeptide transporter
MLNLIPFFILGNLKVIILGLIIPAYIWWVIHQGRKVHPKGLFVLFFAEMWERMSYYGMRALLVLYMVKYLFADPDRFNRVVGLSWLKHLLESSSGVAMEMQPYSSKIYGLYTGLVYLSPFFGGILADRIWGKKKSVYVGAILMAIGHFLMAFENLFLVALMFLIFGNGAFKPNISTQVGNLYKEGDPKKDGAFTLFYMGINLGAFYSPFLCTDLAKWICEQMGYADPATPWHLGFGVAGVGMVIGTLVYHFNRKHLPEETVNLQPAEKHRGELVKTVGAFIAIMVGFVAFLTLSTGVEAVILGLVALAVAYAIYQIKDQIDRNKVAALVILCVGTIAFWAIFEQQGNALELWADKRADWASLGLESTAYQSFNPAFIFIFAPLLDSIWMALSRKGKRSSSVRKMAVGCFLAGIAFLSLVIFSSFMTVDASVINMAWLAIATLIFTLGELYLSPIGLSFVTKVAPKRFLSMMMGMWFLSSFVGNYLSGSLGALYSQISNNQFFMIFAVLGVAVGFFFLIAERKLSKIVGSDV